MMFNLLLASGNPGKVREIRALLSGIKLHLFTPEDIGLVLHVDETGSTYGQNAALKAQVYAQASSLHTIADDTGLEVQALGGLPGVRSARFSPKPDASDADRRQLLLQALHQHPRPWSAQFRCVVAIASPGGILHLAEGACPGEIIPEERGTDGFGYDPIFFLTDLGRTMAELSMQEKNQLSHRAQAVRNTHPVLEVLSGTA